MTFGDYSKSRSKLKNLQGMCGARAANLWAGEGGIAVVIENSTVQIAPNQKTLLGTDARSCGCDTRMVASERAGLAFRGSESDKAV